MARSTTFLSLLRFVACIAALSLTLVAGARIASAGPPTVDTGASGGGTSELETPVLVGSTAEREEVARDVDITEAEMVRGDLSPVFMGDVAVIEVQVAADDGAEFAQTANQRSIAMSEDKLTDDGHLAGWDDIAATEALNAGSLGYSDGPGVRPR